MKVIINKLPLAHIKGDLEKNISNFMRILYVLAGLTVVFNAFTDIVFGIKAVLIYGMSILIARETEIFFITMKANIKRPEATVVIKTTRPEVTGLIFAMLLPVGTPLFVVAVGCFVSIFVGKMVFGGYSFNVFNPAVVGRLFVGIAWPALVTIGFPNILDNFLLTLIFNKDLSSEMLSPLMELQANGIVSLQNMSSLSTLLFKPSIGMIFSLPSIIYILIFIHFAINKTVDLKPIIFTVVSSLIILTIITLGFDLNFDYIFFHLLTGGFLFVTLFMMTDPFTKPFNSFGILYYAVIFTFVYTLIRFLGKDADGVLYALLFSNLFVPLLNKKTKKLKFGSNLKSFISVIILFIVLLGTGLFINTIINQRITNGEIVVNAYVKN